MFLASINTAPPLWLDITIAAALVISFICFLIIWACCRVGAKFDAQDWENTDIMDMHMQGRHTVDYNNADNSS